MVERHHDVVMRRLLLRLEEDLIEQGIVVAFAIPYAECLLIKSILTSVAGFCPYQALYGQLPPLLADVEPASETQLSNDGPGTPGVSRHHHRFQEIVVRAMVDLTAKQPVERALASQALAMGSAEDMVICDQVEFHRRAAMKDQSGWHGLATCVNEADGQHVIK